MSTIQGHMSMRGGRAWLVWLAALVCAASTTSAAGAATVQRVEIGRGDAAVFVINGSLEGGETLALQREIARLPAEVPVSVILNSPGGSLAEGLALGRFFYDARITTFTMGFGGGCHSACSLAFLGGRDKVTGKPARIKMTDGALGFHQFRKNWEQLTKETSFTKKEIDFVVRDTRKIAVEIMKYLAYIGEDMSKLHLMLQAPAKDMKLLDNSEAAKHGIHVMGEQTAELIQATSLKARITGP